MASHHPPSPPKGAHHPPPPPEPERPFKVRIIYKSGATIDVRCTSFTVRRAGGLIASVEWEDAKPKPMYLGVDDVAAVWQL